MIVIKRFNETTNLVHLIIGPETMYQLDLSGALYLDLDDIVKDIPDHEKRGLALMITRSGSEAGTNAFLKSGSSNISPMTNTISGNGVQSTGKVDTSVDNVSVPSITNDPRGLFIENLSCSMCGTKGCFVKTGEIPKCALCIKIDNEITQQKKTATTTPAKKTKTSKS